MIDVNQLRLIHEKMGNKYPFPDLSSPLFVVTETIGNGKLVAAAAVKAVGEAFLWLDPEVPKIEKAEAMVKLEQRCILQAISKGLEEVTAWIPIDIEPQFGKILVKRGWVKSPWPSYTRLLR